MENRIIVKIDKVEYDVTNFIHTHPGGSNILIKFNGLDATSAFNKIGHSNEARDILANLGNDKPPTQWLNIAKMLLFTALLSVAIFLSAFDGTTYQNMITNPYPKAGDFGYGIFKIRGKIGSGYYSWISQTVTAAGYATSWVGYLVHQLGLYYIMYRAQQAKKEGTLEWTDGRNRYSTIAFVFNMNMAALKFIQSHVFYDGLAASVPEVAAQCSVIFFLLFAVMLELPRRGMFFGSMRKWPVFNVEAKTFVRKYHGYFMGFGAIFNFWYHPCEGNLGHFLGFFNQLIFILQTSLLFTRLHRDRYWTFILETFVLIHSLTTALGQGGSIFLLFFNGFLFVIVITQLWGIPYIQQFTNKATKNTRIGIKATTLVLYLGIAAALYGSQGVIGKMYQIVFIPLSYYIIIAFYYLGFVIVGGLIMKTNKNQNMPLHLAIKISIIVACIAWTFLAFLIYASIQNMPLTVYKN